MSFVIPGGPSVIPAKEPVNKSCRPADPIDAALALALTFEPVIVWLQDRFFAECEPRHTSL